MPMTVPSMEDLAALDARLKVVEQKLQTPLPPPVDPPPTGQKMIHVGMTFTTHRPRDPRIVIPDSCVARIKQTCTAAAQSLINFGGDYCLNSYPSSDTYSLDVRFDAMAKAGLPMQYVSAYKAPNALTGQNPGSYEVGFPLPDKLQQVGEWAHGVAAKYLPRGVKNMIFYNEWKGLDPWNRYTDVKRFIDAYHAVWVAIKSDPATRDMQIGGPYLQLTQRQDRAGGGSIAGPWGAVHKAIEVAFNDFFTYCDWDFVAADYSQGDMSGARNLDGSINYNPKRLPQDVCLQYWTDTTNWLVQRAKGKPVDAVEAYGGPFTPMADNFRLAGGRTMLIWQDEAVPYSGFIGNGDVLTPFGQEVVAYRAAGKAYSIAA